MLLSNFIVNTNQWLSYPKADCDLMELGCNLKFCISDKITGYAETLHNMNINEDDERAERAMHIK